MSNLRTPSHPYTEESTNHLYELLFCDHIEQYKQNHQQPGEYPWNILFSGQASPADLQQVVSDKTSEIRVKILACNQLLALGHQPNKRELLAVIVEVDLEGGLDVVASFQDGTARYINQSGKVIIWETQNEQSTALTQQLFQESAKIVQQIGPWNDVRRPHPTTGNLRITFLVSDGLYFGEGPSNVLFQDPMAVPALQAAGRLMQYLTEQVLNAN